MSIKSRVSVLIASTGLILGMGVAFAPTAFAAPDWDELAECESSGRWHINTGNGYYGGIQFSKSTWDAYGGQQYAEYPHNASKAQQIAIGEKTLAGQGPGAWPHCSATTGWESGGPSQASVSADSSTGETQAVRPVAESSGSAEAQANVQARPAEAGEHKVVKGDTLTKIVSRYDGLETVKQIVENNQSVIENPNYIYPKEILDVTP